MHQRHREYERQNAIMTLNMCRIPLGADFHTLTVAQVAALDDEADRVRYRKPKTANGSRCRYFHDLLQRRARRVQA